MKTIIKSIIKKVIGVILIIIGLIALFTPLTPGSWLALIGLELLGIRQFVFRHFLTKKQQVVAEAFWEKLKSKFKKKTGSEPHDKKPD